jgi:low density lipoprotein receptor adapter protein 1
MTDNTTGEKLLQVSIYQISFCSADATHNHVFAFIASKNEHKLSEPILKATDNGFFSSHPLSENENSIEENLVCYAFLCQKRKMAQTVTLTVARAFERAYQIWQNQQFQMERKQHTANQRRDKENIGESTVEEKETSEDFGKSLLIDLDSDAITLDLCHKDGREYLQNTWV